MKPKIPLGANSAPSQRPLADTRAPAEGDGVDTSPRVSDEVKQTTCYMCACRCGIDVHVADGKVRYIQGNKRHPVNRGVHLRQGQRRDHAALQPGASQEASASRRRAWRRRLPRDRMGGGAIDRS